MFDFLLQRFWKKQPDPILSAEGKKKVRKAAANEARLSAIRQAEALPEDEKEVLSFILQSASADARFIAAQKIHSKAALEQIRNAMRNTDRRVTRLMQSRLETLLQNEKQEEQIRACIDWAERLKNESHLLPNLVADLDHQWHAIGKEKAGDTGLIRQYDTLREAIGLRLTDQAALQREAMDVLTALTQLEAEEAALMPTEREAKLAALLSRSQAWAASREWRTLPRQLLSDFEEMKARLLNHTQQHRQMHDALAVRAAMLDEWESMDSSSLVLSELRKKWQALPAGNDHERFLDLEVRFEMFVARLVEANRPIPEEPERSAQETASLFAEALSLMKKAVEAGSVHEATQQNDRIIRLDFSVFEPDAKQSALLADLRTGLKNLVGWAQWGGQASRDELLRMVEALPEKHHPLEELAAAVVEAREKWKALNETSGMASKNQWHQFDAACNRAYEPVIAYARSQAVAREQNREKAQELVDGTRKTLSSLVLSPVDQVLNWRDLLEYQRQVQRAWQQIGPITRKEKKRLSAEFDAVMQPLNTLLKEEAKNEVQRRKDLIEEIRNLDPKDRNAGRMARQLQDRWQERARAFPLASREDQKLWQQFRGASEAIFAHRSKLNEELEKARLQHFHEKEKICEKLEADHSETTEKIQKVLKEADANWRAAGPVSKEHDSAIQKRYEDAVETLLSRMRVIREKQKNEQAAALIEKLSICQKAENAIPDQPELGDRLTALWDAQPSDDWKKKLTPRFEAALRALVKKDEGYADVLKSRLPQLAEQLLRLEIAAAVESPDEFAEKRRQIQMAVLKNSLSGNREGSPDDQLDALCTLPVLTDRASQDRMTRLIKEIKGVA